MRHPESCENVLRDVLLKRFSTRTLDDVTRQANAVIRISWNQTWRKQSPWLILNQKFAQRRYFLGIDDDNFARFFFEAAGMSHQIAQSDRLSKRWMNMKVQICVRVSIEIEFAMLNRMHHRNTRKTF